MWPPAILSRDATGHAIHGRTGKVARKGAHPVSGWDAVIRAAESAAASRIRPGNPPCAGGETDGRHLDLYPAGSGTLVLAPGRRTGNPALARRCAAGPGGGDGPHRARSAGGPVRAQPLVSAHEWYRYRSLGEWRLAGRMVAPAFTFEGFEIAPPDGSPRGGIRNSRAEPRSGAGAGAQRRAVRRLHYPLPEFRPAPTASRGFRCCS